MRRDAPRRAIQQSFFASFNRLWNRYYLACDAPVHASTKISINFSWQIFANWTKRVRPDFWRNLEYGILFFREGEVYICRSGSHYPLFPLIYHNFDEKLMY